MCQINRSPRRRVGLRLAGRRSLWSPSRLRPPPRSCAPRAGRRAALAAPVLPSLSRLRRRALGARPGSAPGLLAWFRRAVYPPGVPVPPGVNRPPLAGQPSKHDAYPDRPTPARRTRPACIPCDNSPAPSEWIVPRNTTAVRDRVQCHRTTNTSGAGKAATDPRAAGQSDRPNICIRPNAAVSRDYANTAGSLYHIVASSSYPPNTSSAAQRISARNNSLSVTVSPAARRIIDRLRRSPNDNRNVQHSVSSTGCVGFLRRRPAAASYTSLIVITCPQKITMYTVSLSGGVHASPRLASRRQVTGGGLPRAARPASGTDTTTGRPGRVSCVAPAVHWFRRCAPLRLLALRRGALRGKCPCRNTWRAYIYICDIFDKKIKQHSIPLTPCV